MRYNGNIASAALTGIAPAPWIRNGLCVIAFWLWPCLYTSAHPLVEDAIDVVIYPDRLAVDARVNREEILVEAGVEQGMVSDERWDAIVKQHGEYVRRHIRFRADGDVLTGRELPVVGTAPAATSQTATVPYRFNYPLNKPPGEIRLIQNLLIERDPWAVTCVVRIRQSDQSAFQSDRLTREGTLVFGCVWRPVAGRGDATSKSAAPAPRSPVRIGWQSLAVALCLLAALTLARRLTLAHASNGRRASVAREASIAIALAAAYFLARSLGFHLH